MVNRSHLPRFGGDERGTTTLCHTGAADDAAAFCVGTLAFISYPQGVNGLSQPPSFLPFTRSLRV